MTDNITRLIDLLLNAFIVSIYLNDIHVVYPWSQRINVDIIVVVILSVNVFTGLQEIEIKSDMNHNEVSDLPVANDIISYSR